MYSRVKGVMNAIDDILLVEYPHYWLMNDSERNEAFDIAFNLFTNSLIITNTKICLADLSCGSIYENHMKKKDRNHNV